MNTLRKAALAALVATLALLDRSAPAVGARWAERLWFTPRRGARPQPEPSADGIDVTFRASGTTLAGRSWGVPGHPVVVLMHGWGGIKEQMTAFVDPLVDQGFEVIAIDAPSHGASGPGRHGRGQSTLLEFMEALEAVATEVGAIDTVVAHSGGAMATTFAIDREQLAARRLVLIAPFANVRPFTQRFADELRLSERTRSRLEERIERRIGSRVDTWDIAAQAARFGGLPLLLVHDDGDAQAPADDSRAIAAAWPGAELLITTGLGHNRVLADPAVVAAVAQFIASRPAA